MLPQISFVSRPLLALGVAAFSVAVSVNAQTISVNESAPSTEDVLIGSHRVPSSAGNLQFNKTVNQDRFGGNLFRLGEASNVDALTLYLWELGNGVEGALATISFVSFDFESDADGLPVLPAASEVYPWNAAQVVHSENFTFPTGSGALTGSDYGKFITFNFSESVFLASGDYGVVFSWVDAGGGRTINFGMTGSGTAGITGFRTTVNNSGATTSYTGAGTGQEILFFLTGTPVPEPSTYAAILGGALVAFALVRRRR